MITFDGAPVLMVGAAVWVVWRSMIWRRRGGDWLRELAVGALFVWSLVVVRLTFFPLIIIFYDWYGRANLIPFASLTQLIQETPIEVATRNIVGNVALFVPFGVLLPLLFEPLRRPWSLIWRVGAISVAIELLQVFTRARTIDIDDVILNTAGGTLGLGVFVVTGGLLGRWETGAALLDRLGSDGPREPLISALVPILATAAIVVPMMVSNLFSATLASGPSGVLADATSIWPGSSVVATNYVNEFLFVAVLEESFQPGLLGLVEYERVLPGRFTRTAWGEMLIEHPSQFRWSLTAFNPSRNEVPVVAVWGANSVRATEVEITNVGLSERLSIPEGDHFVIGLGYDVDALQGLDAVLEDFQFRFFDRSGADVTDQFVSVVR